MFLGKTRPQNQKWAEMGRRATVLSIPGGENDPTGLPEPLGLFTAPKTGKRIFFAPLTPLLGAALPGILHWSPPAGG